MATKSPDETHSSPNANTSAITMTVVSLYLDGAKSDTW